MANSKINYELFYGETKKNGYLSNFYPCSFILNGSDGSDVQVFNCSEQCFMYLKLQLFDPTNKELEHKILTSTNPKIIKKYGRKIKNFNESKWIENRELAMYKALYAKFTQNLELKEKLLSTNNNILVEASPTDNIWGIGFGKKNAFEHTKEWGLNLLGKLLMKLRDELKKI